MVGFLTTTWIASIARAPGFRLWAAIAKLKKFLDSGYT
jgi:hypothetical protein